MSETESKPKPLVGSLVHGLNIIRAFDATDPEMTLTQVAEKTGMDRAGARRYLLTLVELGYVQQQGRLFRLSPKVMELGYSFLSSVPMAEKAPFYLSRMRDASGFPMALAIRDGDFIVHVAAANTDAFHSPALSIGRRFRLAHASAGRCILAFSSAAEQEATLARLDMHPASERSLQGREELAEELSRIRGKGHAVVDQEMQIGIRSLAVPVLNLRSEIMGCLVTYTYVGVTDPEDMMRLALPAMREAAEEIGRTLI